MKDTDDEVRCREDPEGGTGGLLNTAGKRGMVAGRVVEGCQGSVSHAQKI